MGWQEECAASLKKDGLNQCSKVHCDDLHDYTHRWCACKLPSQHLDPCPYGSGTYLLTYDVDGSPCGCCCTCLAYGTPVQWKTDKSFSMDAFKPIETFEIGDKVLAADRNLNWVEKTVKFSQGTGKLTNAQIMVKVIYELNDQEKQLITTRSHLFLMPNGKLKRADTLSPGKDKLVAVDGSTTTVKDLRIGKFAYGIHHISTSDDVTKTIDGHLLNTNGIVTADYSLQISNIDLDSQAEFMVENHENLPSIGTKEYAEANSDLVTTSFCAYHKSIGASALGEAKQDDSEASDGFKPLSGAVDIPEDAMYFVSKKQAWDIETSDAPRQPPSSSVGLTMAENLYKIYNGFYPKINFHTDLENTSPNAYAFFKYEVPFVVISGGLLRMDDLDFPTLAFIIAHEIAHLYGGEPKSQAGYACTGLADYAAITEVISGVWYGPLNPQIVPKAREGVKKLFSYISPEHAKGTPGDTCLDIPIQCRIDTFSQAMMGFSLPECAGGPKKPALKVEEATASEEEGETTVHVVFNKAVDKATAEKIRHYALAPLTGISDAKVNAEEDWKVDLKAEIKAETEYTLTVSNVLSADKEPLVSGEKKATFTLPKEA